MLRRLGTVETITLIKDVTKPEHCKETVEETLQKFGRNLFLINSNEAGSYDTLLSFKVLIY